MATTILRFLVTSILLYLVYTETGPWTTIFLATTTLHREMTAFYLRALAKHLKVKLA